MAGPTLPHEALSQVVAAEVGPRQPAQPQTSCLVTWGLWGSDLGPLSFPLGFSECSAAGLPRCGPRPHPAPRSPE